jgi:flavin-dependent dehydrogenase
MFDLAVVGAGPAGLLAALIAARKGMGVVLIDKRRDVGRITRACCQQLIMDDGYEGESVQAAAGKISFPANAFALEYGGPLQATTDMWYISPENRRIHFTRPGKKPIVTRFDKGALLRGLHEKAHAAGVEIYPAAVVYDVKDYNGWVELAIAGGGNHSLVAARKVIAADGANSRTVAAAGLNEGRQVISTGLSVIYECQGVAGVDSDEYRVYCGTAFGSNAPVHVYPSLTNPGVVNILVGTGRRPPEIVFNKFIREGRAAAAFRDAKVVSRSGSGFRMFSGPLATPHKGGILAIGDAAAYIEVEVQGALMCGWHAGQAAVDEFQGEGGWAKYTAWWRKAFPFFDPLALRAIRAGNLVGFYADDMLDYLFGLLEGQEVEGSYSPYRFPLLLWGAVMQFKDRIVRERPDVWEKVKKTAVLCGLEAK